MSDHDSASREAEGSPTQPLPLPEPDDLEASPDSHTPEQARRPLLPCTVLTETSRYDLLTDAAGSAWIRRTPGGGLGTLPGAGREAHLRALDQDEVWEPLVKVLSLSVGQCLVVLVLRANGLVPRLSTLIREIHWPGGQRPCEHLDHYPPDGTELPS